MRSLHFRFQSAAILIASLFLISLAHAQAWKPVGSAAVAGRWNNLTCNTVANGTWQPLGCFSCPAGWTVSGSNCVQDQTSTIAATAVYGCSSGSLSGTNCNLTSTYSASIASYYCPSGGSLGGSWCNTSWSYGASGSNYSYGPPGAYWDGQWGVWRVSCASGSANGWGTGIGPDARNRSMCGYYSRTGTNYSCPSGGSLSGSTCNVSSGYGASVGSWSCPSGGSNNGNGTCTISSTSAATVSSYACSAGTVTGNVCAVQVNTEATPVYCAAPSTRSGSTCLWPNVAATVSSYYCSAGYTMTDGVCVSHSTATIPATAGPQTGF